MGALRDLGDFHGFQDFHIREATPADRCAVEACALAAFEKYVSRMGKEPAPMRDDYRGHIERGSAFVGECSGRVVGFLVLRLLDDAVLLDTVALLPAFQGRGLGRAFMAFTEEFAARHGKAGIVLYTNVAMTENQAFYRGVGFEEYARKREDGYERVYYRKRMKTG